MTDPSFYNKSGPFTLGEIANLSEAELSDPKHASLIITDISTLGKASTGHISCLHNSKYIGNLTNTQASACILQAEHIKNAPPHLALLIAKHPYRSFGIIAKLFYPTEVKNSFISPSAVIHPTAKIGKNCSIGHGSIIEENVTIGDYCQIDAHCVISKGVILGESCRISACVTISHTIMGNFVFIKPGARIGQPGFGFHMDEKGHFDIPQLGRVMIGNDVHIGANTTVDRGSELDTVIGSGTRIDNLVQIAHNAEVGENCVLVAQSGIAGSTKLGRFVIVAGQVGIAGHLNIGDKVRIAAQSGIMRDVAAGETIAGSPAVPIRDWHKQTIAITQMIKGKKHV